MENDGKTVITTEKPKVSYSFMGKTYDDKDMIAYFTHENFVHKIENKLIGEYDQSGRYTIPKEILKDLVSLRKQIVKKDNQTYFLKAICGKEIFEFKIEIGVVSKSESFAQLYLIEKAFNIVGEEKLEVLTPIVFYTDDSDAYFETKIKKIFNILQEDEVEGRMKENDLIALNLLEKIKFWSKMYERYLLESRLRDKIYIEKLLRILAQDQDAGPVILKKYEELIKKYSKSLDPKNKNYYRVLKQLLDSILIEEEKSVSKEVALLIQRLRKVYVQANQETIDLITIPEKKVEKKDDKIKLPSGVGSITFKSASSVKKVSEASRPFSSAMSELKHNVSPLAPTPKPKLKMDIKTNEIVDKDKSFLDDDNFKSLARKYNIPNTLKENDGNKIKIVEDVKDQSYFK